MLVSEAGGDSTKIEQVLKLAMIFEKYLGYRFHTNGVLDRSPGLVFSILGVDDVRLSVGQQDKVVPLARSPRTSEERLIDLFLPRPGIQTRNQRFSHQVPTSEPCNW